MEKLPYALI